MKQISALFTGKVMHMRLRPKRHRFNYRVFSMLLDIDELVQLDQSMRLFSYNRWGLVSFHDKDHGNGSPDGLRAWIEEKLCQANLQEVGLSIHILCYPRIFGYAFNPLTLYFCYRADGILHAILYEVCNTFGERHTYIIPVVKTNDGSKNQFVRQSCAKDFYVSPFIPMECRYNFQIEPPHENVQIRIEEEDADGMLLIASFVAKRGVLNDRSLGTALLLHPLMTLKVTLGIYWEAFRLWAKGVVIHRHKAAKKPISSTVVAPYSAITQQNDSDSK